MRKLTLQDAILGAANYAIISTTATGVVTTFNSTAERWLGYTAAEVIGKLTPTLWHDADEMKARAKILSSELGLTVEPGFEAFVAKARLGQTDENEWTLIRKDGSRFPVSLSATALFDEAGIITGYLGMIADITERRRATTALLESKRFLQSTLNALSSHIAILDEHGTIIEVNGAWNHFATRNTFMGSDRGVGDNYLQVCDSASGRFSEEAPVVAAGIRAVMAGECGEFHLEYPCHSPQEQRWFIVRATRFAGDKSIRVVVAHENITERRRSEEALQISEERVRLATEAAGVAVWEWDIKSGAIHWDEQIFKIYGMPSTPGGRVTYEDWRVRVFPEDLAEQEEKLQRTAQTCGRSQREFRIVRASDHAIRFIQAAEMAVAGADGKATRVVGINLDITERKKLEAEREKLIGELQQALAEVKTLSGMIPICGWCKKIRSDQGYWQSVEQYVGAHTDATFSHGMCPDCAEKFKADISRANAKQVA
jgi:PAS domain S-box-containing protein